MDDKLNAGAHIVLGQLDQIRMMHVEDAGSMVLATLAGQCARIIRDYEKYGDDFNETMRDSAATVEDLERELNSARESREFYEGIVHQCAAVLKAADGRVVDVDYIPKALAELLKLPTEPFMPKVSVSGLIVQAMREGENIDKLARDAMERTECSYGCSGTVVATKCPQHGAENMAKVQAFIAENGMGVPAE